MLQPRSSDALVIVDVQNDFCAGGSLAVPDGNAVIGPINRLSPLFSTVVLTQEWHPRGHVTFASTHALPEYSRIDLPYGEQILWPDHCVAGTHGAAFHADLDTSWAQAVIMKGTVKTLDSYSAFVAADKTTSTGLAGLLRDRQVKRVFVCGLALDFCVSATAMDARHAGFEVVVLEDASRAIDMDRSLADSCAAMDRLGIHRTTALPG